MEELSVGVGGITSRNIQKETVYLPENEEHSAPPTVTVAVTTDVVDEGRAHVLRQKIQDLEAEIQEKVSLRDTLSRELCSICPP
jgi:hypothetical protein